MSRNRPEYTGPTNYEFKQFCKDHGVPQTKVFLWCIDGLLKGTIPTPETFELDPGEATKRFRENFRKSEKLANMMNQLQGAQRRKENRKKNKNHIANQDQHEVYTKLLINEDPANDVAENLSRHTVKYIDEIYSAELLEERKARQARQTK